MSTATAPVRLMHCPACNNPIYVSVTYKVDFGEPRPVVDLSIETTVTVTAKVSGLKIFHDCRDGKPASEYLANVAK